MEVQGAVILWQRSIEKLKMRYVAFVSDGNSCAFPALNDGSGPYDEVTVTKEECINHVSKRLGTRLRQIKEQETIHIKTKTGKILKSLLGVKNKRDKLID